MPIGRSHVESVLDRTDVVEKARSAAIEDRLSIRGLPHHRDQISHPAGTIGKHIGEFARHGDGVHGPRRTERERLGERRIELACVLQERAGDLRHLDGAPPVDTGKFEIGAAEVPADH